MMPIYHPPDDNIMKHNIILELYKYHAPAHILPLPSFYKVLDDAELALKNMAAGDDELDTKKVYDLMQEHLQTQKSLWKFKRIAAAFFVVIIILALSNLGTSFAAAYLSKDTTTSGGDLKGTGADGEKTLGTQTAAEQFEGITPGRYGAGCSKADGTCAADQPLSCCPGFVCNSSTETCEVDKTVTSFLELTVEHGKTMVMDCKADRTVHFSREFEDGRVTDYAFCPLTTGQKAVYDMSNPELPSVHIDMSSGHVVVIAPNSDGSFYTITGDGVTSHAGFPCDNTIDCDPGLVCKMKTRSCSAVDGNNTSA